MAQTSAASERAAGGAGSGNRVEQLYGLARSPQCPLLVQVRPAERRRLQLLRLRGRLQGRCLHGRAGCPVFGVPRHASHIPGSATPGPSVISVACCAATILECISLVLFLPLTSAARGVNRSPKFLDLRKCPNPIRTSVGHPIFSWTIFGQNFSCSKFYAFVDALGLWSTIR